VAKKEHLFELLKEKRTALITQAVTKGLDSNVPMKDSGVEWLGEIPACWEVGELRRLNRKGTSITYGIVQAGPHVENGVPYILRLRLAMCVKRRLYAVPDALLLNGQR
jgi:type I restriction enzyme, S subunit